MAEGLPLPWPFPWSTRSSLLRKHARQDRSNQAPAGFKSAAVEPIAAIRSSAERALAEFGLTLPQVKATELYLIRGLTTYKSSEGEVIGVIYPPEFLYVLDVGTPTRIGGSFQWQNLGTGDPTFPDPSKLTLRSIIGDDDAHLIYPVVPGSLLIGLKPGTPEADVRAALEKEGLKDIEYLDFLAFARCAPFQESDLAATLGGKLDFATYIEVDHVVRLIDFSPGWRVERLL
ncbi:hypothetical protein NKJ46_25325 [Mesorhizobium sp. M0166]|uniref:hypothetical protein n=1 Tax=unclassified Mesorhizobium TaxID=325217 RepID=UPI0033377A98